jgi:polar amino acid transport system permease protein
LHGFDPLAVLAKPEYRALFLHGLEATLIIAVFSWLLGMAVALLLLVARLTPSRIAGALVTAYISYHRNVPTLVQLMLWYFGIASLLPDALQQWLGDHGAEVIFAIIALGLCQAAYFSEDMRSGLRAVPPGQSQAARALGHGFVSTLRFVLLPQALRNAMPALVSHTVSLFKNSSLAMAIGAAELTHAVTEVESASFRTFETFFIGAVLYLAFSLLLMGSGAVLDRRVRIAGAH